MSKRGPVIGAAFVLGFFWMLAASPAAAKCINECTCATSCDELCVDGPCPECEIMTCEEWGKCIGSWDCTDPCTTCTSTINGSSGGDTLNGGSNSECINGLGGDDTISGNGGNDCLYGNAGTDYADGGSGTDFCDAEIEINCEL